MYLCLCLLGSCIRKLWRPTQTTLQTGTRTWHWPVRGCSARVTGATVQTACWPAAPSTSDSTWRRNPRTPRHLPYAQPSLTFSKRETGSTWTGGKPRNKTQRDTLRGCCKELRTKPGCVSSRDLKAVLQTDRMMQWCLVKILAKWTQLWVGG